MKKLFYLAALFALVASPVAAKTCICHVEGENDAHLILVADASVPSHVEQHGDCIVQDPTLCDGEDDTCDPTNVDDEPGTCDNN